MKNKTSYVTFDGRTIVDTNALLQAPKVKATLRKLSASTKKLIQSGRGQGISVVKRAPVNS
jgi:hypothetical protein